MERRRRRWAPGPGRWRPPRGVLLAAAACATLLCATPPAGAAGLTLGDAIDRALRDHPLVDAAARNRARASAGVDRARAAFLPRLDASRGYTRGDQPVYAFGSRLNQGRFTAQDFDVGRLNEPGALDNFRSAITLSQPLYTGGRITLDLARARAGERIAERQEARATQEVIFQAAQAYFGLSLAEERVRAVRTAVRAAEANLDLVRQRFRSGFTVESDVLAAEVRLARLREEALAAAGQAAVARARLNDAMGAPLDQPLEALEPLGFRAASPGAPDEALGWRPDYEALRIEEEVRTRDIQVARSAFLPNVGLEGTYEVNTAEPFSDGQGSWSVMAVLRWNLFSGGADLARTREAAAARDQARALRARAASRIGLEVREARARLDTARERAAVAERAIAQAEEALRIVRTRYQAGLSTIVHLVGAEADLTDARLRLTEALYEMNVGVAAWELALGRLDAATLR